MSIVHFSCDFDGVVSVRRQCDQMLEDSALSVMAVQVLWRESESLRQVALMVSPLSSTSSSRPQVTPNCQVLNVALEEVQPVGFMVYNHASNLHTERERLYQSPGFVR